MQYIDIFWTGGLDSTYRVLELILIKKRKIQPHYIIDSSRPSTLYELKAIEKIKSQIKMREPRVSDLLMPLNLIQKTDIKPNEESKKWYEGLNSYLEIGTQWEWLSCFTEEFRLNAVEVALVKHPGWNTSDLQKMMLGNLQGKGHFCRLHNLKNSDLSLFKNFAFPVIHLTKLDLRFKALEYGFYDLLELTWFCHKPSHEGLPCGLCHPCQRAKESGFKYNFRFCSDLLSSRFRHSAKRTAKNIYITLGFQK